MEHVTVTEIVLHACLLKSYLSDGTNLKRITASCKDFSLEIHTLLEEM